MKLQAPAIVLIENDEVTLDLYQRELGKSFTVFGFTETNDVLAIIANQDIRAVVIEPEIQARERMGIDPYHLSGFSRTVHPDRGL